MIPLNNIFLESIARYQGLIHLSGTAGSGKTLLAAAIAAKISRQHHVDWLSTDGKTGFIDHLKRNLNYYGGLPSNLSITRSITSSDALRAVLDVTSRIKYNTRLVVIDPITRVLDMSRSDPVLWGRSLFEEALPTLAGVADSNSLLIIITSEVRDNDNGSQAVYHKKIKPWLVADFTLDRSFGRQTSHIYKSNETSAIGIHVASMQLRETGEVAITDEKSPMEVC
jgi:hypothetical protein